MAARSRHPTLSPTTPKRVHQQDTTPTPPTSYLNGGAKPPNPHSGRLPKKRVNQQDTTPTSPTSNLNGGAQPPPHTQPDNPKARSSTRHNANTSHLLSQWRREAAQPTLSSTTQNHNHQSDKAITYSTTTINGGAKPPNPHLARQPKSALIDQTQRQYIPLQISMAARSRQPTISPTAQKSAFITHTRR